MNPRDIKLRLAAEMVERFHGREAAERAHADFRARFQRGVLPEDLPEVSIAAAGGQIGLAALLKAAGLAASTSEAIRLVNQGGVRLDGERMSDPRMLVAVGAAHVCQVGKRRALRVRVTPG
jgi:tyrosyl-tRNA synthetase